MGYALHFEDEWRRFALERWLGSLLPKSPRGSSAKGTRTIEGGLVSVSPAAPLEVDDHPAFSGFQNEILTGSTEPALLGEWPQILEQAPK
jgi:hypothetical protein